MSKEIASYNDLSLIEGIAVSGVTLTECPSKSDIESRLESGYILELADTYADNELVGIDDINVTFKWPTILFSLSDTPNALSAALCHSAEEFTGDTMDRWDTFYRNATQDHAKLSSADKFVLSVGSEKKWLSEYDNQTYYLCVRTSSTYYLYSFVIPWNIGYRINDPEMYGYDHQEPLGGNKVRELLPA